MLGRGAHQVGVELGADAALQLGEALEKGARRRRLGDGDVVARGRLDAEEGVHEAVVREELRRQTAHEEGRGEPVPVLLLLVRDGLAIDEYAGVPG